MSYPHELTRPADDYHLDLGRRTDQFSAYLKKMDARAHEEVGGPCFMIFSERLSNGTSGQRSLAEAANAPRELVLAEFDDTGIASLEPTDYSRIVSVPDERWKDDDSQCRFIQFSFERDWFCLDMPLNTLYQAEADVICRSRLGFFYLQDRPEFTLYEEDVDGYDPFRKIYTYGDEGSAAEDMAFIFFQVWNFPVDWRFFVKAASFGEKKHEVWEQETPIE